MADVDLDALEARLRNHVCGRCDNGMTTAPCRGCEAVARQANERARRGISSTVGIGHRGACTATPITCRMCEGTGKRLPMDGETMLALIARVREAEIALGDVHALLTNAGVEDPEVSHREGYALSLRVFAMAELCRQQRDAAIEQRDAARAEVAAMAETLAHAAHARGAVEEYPDGTDELSLALERAEKAEAACAALLTELHALRAEVGWLRKVRDAAEALIAPHGSLAKMRDVGIDQRAITIERLRAALDAKGGG